MSGYTLPPTRLARAACRASFRPGTGDQLWFGFREMSEQVGLARWYLDAARGIKPDHCRPHLSVKRDQWGATSRRPESRHVD